ncbi:MAG TPA: hypothetical protein VGL70_00185 [Candidatus Binatia bacterium]|jgi:hypothetical protein
MSTFTTRVATPTAAPDPTRHVNYNLGMVLGADDFNQEFAYLAGHDQWMARDLVGYGTVSGLRVSIESDGKGPRVMVEPGVALSPQGQLIRVPSAQCAYLNDWLKLDTTKKKLLTRLASPPSTVKAYVVLWYRECPSEKVPIPGEPCRSEDDIMLPSRLVDDFRLELMLDPPGQREEDAVRDFVAWLRQIEVSDTSPGTSLQVFLDTLRSAAHLLTSPPAPGPAPLADYMFGSPLASLVINSAKLYDYLNAAFRLWVTELRPKWRPDFFAGAHGCSSNGDGPTVPIEQCLLLAEVDVPAIVPGGGADWQVEHPDLIRVAEERRPIVVHLRMLQETLLGGRREHVVMSPPSGGGVVNLAGDATGSAAATRVERIQQVAIDPTPPRQDEVLTFRNGQWRPTAIPAVAAALSPSNTVAGEETFGQPRNAGALAAYSRADHTHGTPPDPIPAHRADPGAHNIAGDVTGTVGATTVVAIRNQRVVGTPADGQVLTFRANQWQAEIPAAAARADAVERPAGLPRYAIVAAGIVKCDGTARPPVYNGLVAKVTGNSQVTVAFEDGRVPDGSFQYVVKVLPVLVEGLETLAISFIRFLQTGGFQLRITRGAETINREELARLELMIEVSRFER